MTYILLAVALSLSAVAAWYAIAGLVAIFAAAAVPIMIMGGLLEAAKLVVASWLYRNWKEVPKLLKTYFSIALVILMMLTSMGIFGFLSKAHLDQAVPTGEVVSKLNLIDEKIKTEKENIDVARKTITQLDNQVNATLARSDDTKGAERSITIRRNQQRERAKLLEEINVAQTKIAKLQEERQPIAAEVRKVEAEVGPIKYIAALIYGDQLDESLLEKAVRIVTIMIVLVFDPLAVLMLVGYNWSLKNQTPKVQPPVVQTVEEEKPEPEPDPDPQPDPPPAPAPAEESSTKPEPEPELEPKPPKQDWQPEIYNRPSVQEKPKELGRYLQEIQGKTKTIEKEVEDLQSPK